MGQHQPADAAAHRVSDLDWSAATLQEMFEEVDDALERYAATILEREHDGLPEWLVEKILESGEDAFDPAWIPSSFLAYLVESTLDRLARTAAGQGSVTEVPMAQFANALIAWRDGDQAEAQVQVDEIEPDLVAVGAVVLHSIATGATDSLDWGRPRPSYAYRA